MKSSPDTCSLCGAHLASCYKDIGICGNCLDTYETEEYSESPYTNCVDWEEE